MKRSPLNRGTSTLTRSPMKRTTTTIKRSAMSTTRTDTGPDQATRDLVIARDGESCRRCGYRAVDIQHRKPRGSGGTSDPAINYPENLVCVCRTCHEWMESNRRVAYELGWLVARTKNPLEIPLVSYVRRTMTMLLHDGTAVEDALIVLPDTEPVWTTGESEPAW